MVESPHFWVVEAKSLLLRKDLVSALIEILVDITGRFLVCGGEIYGEDAVSPVKVGR